MRKITRLFLYLASSFGVLAFILLLLWLLGGSQVALAQSGTGVIRVATTGSDTPGCGDQTTPCRTVQYAVDQAQVGEEIRIAAGDYTDIHVRAGITQMVYISKTITVRGGYTTAFADPSDPEANPTTLDAQGQGRVLYITGDINPTIEGLRITGGNAAGLGGDLGDNDAGGGVYVITATASISNNHVFSNTAEDGGGLYLFSSDATLSGNTISGNFTNGDHGMGGGLYLAYSDATLSGNTVTSNTADSGGGGLHLGCSNATLSGNTVTSNTADSGGGLHLGCSDATLSGNIVTSNTASVGGGLYLEHSPATLSGNVVTANTANANGGGLFLYENRFLLCIRPLTHTGEMLVSNLVVNNRANGLGSGLYILGSSVWMLHTSIARNTGGDGSGIYVTGYKWGLDPRYCPSSVALTNTILVSHTVGITVTAGNTAMLESTLWHGNITNWGGAGTMNRSNDYTGAPAFVAPDAGDYHIGASSAAIDVGVDAGITVDIDGEPRPVGAGYDIGADEFPAAPALTVTKQATPDPVQAGSQLTYSIRVTNIGNGDATEVTITDTIPTNTTFAWADSGGTLVGNQVRWTGQTVSAGSSLTVTFVVTVTSPLADGTLITNADYGVSCAEGVGASGEVVTTPVESAPALSIVKTDAPDTVLAGELLTYTIVVNNTGNGDATNAAITDTIPVSTTFASADSGGGLVGNQVRWTGQTVSAGSSLTVAFAVTVDSELDTGTLITNADYGVTCAEGVGASGEVVTTTVEGHPSPPTDTYLPIVIKGYCACGPDNYEPNDSFDQAHVSLTSGQTYQSWISCCDVGSQSDYFYIDASTTNAINIDLTNIPAGVDYDLYLCNASQVEVARSWKDGNAPEHISYNPTSTGRYYILVFSPHPHYSESPYSLRVTYD